ncbi:MAG: hypothetical protein EOS85_11580 [Mesorhizobium sp.]|nr:MAG: hypothetical protein EOS85_11580 [Mesorhizobium sp.]
MTTDIEKATFYIVGHVDGCFAAIGLRDARDLRDAWGDDGTTKEDMVIDVDEGLELNARMRRRIREQFPKLSDTDIDAAYDAAAASSIAYIVPSTKLAEIQAERHAEIRAESEAT